MSPPVDTGSVALDDRRHCLLVAESDSGRRRSVAAWVERSLAFGEKVYYKGWHDPAEPQQSHWLAGLGGARSAPAALRSGQLELADYGSMLADALGADGGVRGYHNAEIERALDEGWPAVAMAHETVRRPMADASLAAQVAEHESGYDVLMQNWPLRVLCQLTLPEENEAAAWETVAMHHRDLDDGPWAARTTDGLWQPYGEIDAHVARRFGAAAHGALLDARHEGPAPDLHIDLAEVKFIDVTSVTMLMVVAQSAPLGQQVVLHHVPRAFGRLVEAVGRPKSVVYGSDR